MSGIVTSHALVHVGGRERTLFLVRPDSSAAPATSWRGRALVVVLHGSNQTGEGVRALSDGGFDRLAESGAAVIAYPDGVGRHWNDARLSIDFSARRQGVDDVAFLEAMIDRLADTDGIDRARVFLVGFSNGGAMTIRVLLQRPDLLAGAAVLSATLPAPENLLPIAGQPRPLPVALFHGTRDPLVPYGGGMASLWGLKPRGIGLSAPQTAAFFAERNEITDPPVTTMLPSLTGGRPDVELTEYAQEGRDPVRLYTVLGGGHVIPGSDHAPVALGHVTHEIVATSAIADFFGLT